MHGRVPWPAGLCFAVLVSQQGRDAQGRADLEFRRRACLGTPVIQDDPAWLRAQLDALTDSQERGRAQPWRVDDAPADFIAAQMRAIVGVEIRLSRTEGKWKLSQNRTPADRQGVAQGLAQDGLELMAGLVARAGRPD